MERKPAPVLQKSDHASRSLVVLFRAHPFGRTGREHLQAEVAAEVFQFVNGRANGRAADQPDNIGRDLPVIDLAFLAVGAKVPRLQGFMRDLYLFRAGVVLGAVAAVAFAFLVVLWPVVALGRRRVLRILGFLPICGSRRLRVWLSSTLLVFSVLAPKDDLAQPVNGRVFVARSNPSGSPGSPAPP